MSGEQHCPFCGAPGYDGEFCANCNYEPMSAEQNAVEGLSEGDRDRQALEAACLEGLIHTKHGYRYRPSLGADAIERIVADRERRAEARGAVEVLRRTAVEVRKYADTFDDIGSGGTPALLYGVAETIDSSADRIEEQP